MKANSIVISGNTSREIRFAYSKSGHPVLTFSLAHQQWKKVGTSFEKQEPIWFRCTAFGELAEAYKSLQAGPVVVTGKLKQTTFKGVKGLEILLEQIEVVEKSHSQRQGDLTPMVSQTESELMAESDIPF